jgi:hypothetical protein
MATNRIDALRGLAQRVEWEHTLADLHLRARLDIENEAAAAHLGMPSVETAGVDQSEPSPTTAERTSGSWRTRELRRRRSPVRL